MNCPYCLALLRLIAYEGVEIHTCDGCGGEFIGGHQLGHIVRQRETAFGPSIRDLYADHKPLVGVPEHETGRHLKCPACAKPMDVVNYGTDSGVCVDRCDGCGAVWLDHAELEKIQVIMEHWQDRAPAQLRAIAGELERARRQAAESTSRAFAGSRFSLVNAVINRLLDAA